MENGSCQLFLPFNRRMFLHWPPVTSAAVREWDESSRYLRMLLVENPDSQALANGFNAICVLYVTGYGRLG
jgi:hypothetical protein